MNTKTGNRTNYIFIDYENVQDIDLDLIAGKPVKIFLIVGSRRKTMPTELTRKLLRYHEQVTLIESEGASKDALDLVLAYHVGQQTKADPGGYFHILSKDKDYDALIKHLRTNDILANRVEVFAKVSALMDFKKLSLDERVKIVLEKLKNPKVTRPAKKKTLLSSIHALLHKEFSGTEIEQVMQLMVKRKVIEISPKQMVIYKI